MLGILLVIYVFIHHDGGTQTGRTQYVQQNAVTEKKLEMWGRAKREATRRCASDWGHNLGKGRVKIPLVATSRVSNSVTLAYTARAVLIVGGSTIL